MPFQVLVTNVHIYEHVFTRVPCKCVLHESNTLRRSREAKKTTYNLIYIHGIIEKCRFFREFRVNKEAICKMVNNIVSR